jgi:hypothetical protein
MASEPLGDPVDAEKRDARGGKLDTEWQAVEAPADLDDGRCCLGRERERRLDLAHPVDEQTHRRHLTQQPELRWPHPRRRPSAFTR